MKSPEIWKYIHEERVSLANTLEALNADQWSTMSWCENWTVQKTAGHVVAAAEQTFPGFYGELITAGFSFDKFADKAANKNAAAGPAELVRRLRARTTTTNHPPAPTMAMLGEIVAHGEDIRRPLGLVHRSPDAALLAVADSWKNSNLLIGAKRRITGLTLTSTDIPWSTGTGPEVRGPLQSLVMAMIGRKGSHVDLSGDGVALLASR